MVDLIYASLWLYCPFFQSFSFLFGFFFRFQPLYSFMVMIVKREKNRIFQQPKPCEYHFLCGSWRNDFAHAFLHLHDYKIRGSHKDFYTPTRSSLWKRFGDLRLELYVPYWTIVCALWSRLRQSIYSLKVQNIRFTIFSWETRRGSVCGYQSKVQNYRRILCSDANSMRFIFGSDSLG